MSSISSTTTSGAQNLMHSRRLEQMFQRRDSNGDGKLSLEEFTKQLLPGSTTTGQSSPGAGRVGQGREALFGRIDTDRDGFVTKDELDSFAKERIQAARNALLELQDVFGNRGPRDRDRAGPAAQTPVTPLSGTAPTTPPTVAT